MFKLHPPGDTRGVARVDDRRVISGIIHVLKSSGRWPDAPRDQYGPHKSLFNRFVRSAEKGVWADLVHALASAGGPPAQVLIDSTAVRTRRCASGGKGGEKSGGDGSSISDNGASTAAAPPETNPAHACFAVRLKP